jgi:hypothetical protein
LPSRLVADALVSLKDGLLVGSDLDDRPPEA